MNTNMSLMFYYADCKKTFENVNNESVKQLADEISQISMMAPIHEPSHQFKNGFFDKVLKNLNLKLITSTKDNKFKIAGREKEFTTLHLMATLSYCVNRLSGGQLNDKMDYIKMGELLCKK